MSIQKLTIKEQNIKDWAESTVTCRNLLLGMTCNIASENLEVLTVLPMTEKKNKMRGINGRKKIHEKNIL